MAEASPIRVVIEDDDNSVRTDPDTGTIETDQPDGSTVVQIFPNGPPRKQKEGEDPWYKNLAEEIDKMELAGIANELIDAIEADHRSREGHLQVVARGLGLLGL